MPSDGLTIEKNKMNIKYFIIVLFFISLFTNFIDSLTILNSTITNKNVNILGVELDYALIDVEFSSPLYRYNTLGCPNWNCTIDTIDCSCDYSDINNCPNNNNRNSSCPACPLIDSYGFSYCKNEINTITVVKDKEYILNISSVTQLRYKANASICEGLLITNYPINGFYKLTIGNLQTSHQTIIGDNPQIYSLIRKCPSDQSFRNYSVVDLWTKDTYYINITPMEGVPGNVTLYFKISSEPVPPKKPIISNNCTQVLATHKCINEGDAIFDTGAALTYNYYTFVPSKTAVYTFRAPNIQNPIFIIADTINIFPSFNNGTVSDWNSIQESENYITVYLEESTIVYVSIYFQYPTYYTFSVTSEGYKESVKISSLPPKAAAYALMGTSKLILREVSLYCFSWYNCYPFSYQAPFSDPNPLYPIPSVFNSLNLGNIPSYQSFDIDSNFTDSINENSYQLSVLYSYRIGSAPPTQFSTFQAITVSYIRFLSNLFDENDNVLTIKNYTYLNSKELQCNYTEFNQVLTSINGLEDIFYNTTDLDLLYSLRYKLDSLTIQDPYVGCTQKIFSLMESEIRAINYTSTGCHYQINSPEYYNSSCCYSVLEYYECCLPDTIERNTTQYTSVSSNTVEKQCSNPSCTEQILKQYFDAYSQQDECIVPANTLNYLMSSTIEVLRNCKIPNVNEAPNCNVDSDCTKYSGPNSTCDLYQRKCLPNFEYIDKAYLHCVYSSLDQSTVYKILHRPFEINETIIDEIYKTHLKDDVVSVTFNFRSDYAYLSDNIGSYSSLFYPDVLGLDKSMELVHDVKYDGSFSFIFDNSTTWDPFWNIFGMCPLFYNCFGYYNQTLYSENGKTCYDACEYYKNSGFCGYCSTSENFCYNFGYDQSKCNNDSQPYCMYNDGYVNTALTKEQCENSGTCSEYCDYKCNGGLQGQVCLIETINTQVECTALGDGNLGWSNSGQFCYFQNITEKVECDDISQYWVNCSSLNIDECSGPLGRLSNLCYLKGVPCTTKEDCENAGSCSDSFFFDSTNTQGYPQGLGLGKCVRKHQIHGSNIQCKFNLNGYTEQDSPMGCFSHFPQVKTKKDCELLGPDYSWWSPSLNNKTKCLQEKGCQTYITSPYSKMLPYNKVFNEMDEAECNGCFNNTDEWKTNYQWKNKFTWKSGYWYTGTPTKGIWMTGKNFTYASFSTKTLDYQKIYDELTDSVNSQMADLLRNEYICRQQRVKDNLNSITCSCYGDGGSECFKETTLSIAQLQPCSGPNDDYSFNYGEIVYSNKSVKEGCGNLKISQYPKNIFTNTQDQHFPSNFVSYPKPIEFGIVNSKDAIIGTILSDGIKLETQNIHQLTICFNVDSNKIHSDKFPIYDFASQNLENGILFPLNTLIYFNNSKMCSNIVINDPIITLFPANRLENWESEKKTFFNNSTIGLLYTLAVVYLLVTIYAFYQLVIIAIVRAKGIIKRFELVHLLLFMIFVFVIIRSIYFFLLPNGSLSDNTVADYILVILPTFFYFSIYTIIIILWYVIVLIVLQSNSSRNLKKRVYSLLGLVNLIIYILLVIVILVFNYTKESKPNVCGNRVIFSAVQSSSQKAVSILYAVVQAVISLVIGGAFIYLGTNLYRAMSKVNSKSNGRASNHQRKIFLLTTVCSVGFILHCIFILVVVGINEPSIVFSFIGLIITEIIPCVVIIYTYDQRISLSLDMTLSSKSTSSTGNSSKDTKLSTISEPTTTFSSNLSSEF